jgi:ubiquinone/menaquinone biosynthesis C-methylase UbiE
MDPKGYAEIWMREEDLDNLNKRIHDGVPMDQLAGRADGYRNLAFEILHPHAKPKEGAKVMEFGSGVGWIMESMLRKYPTIRITGVDISKNMIEKAQERWKDDRAKFVLYNNLKLLFSDDFFDTIYSFATIQHIEKHIAFILFQELFRVLAPKGHAVLHFLSIHLLATTSKMHYTNECWNHINNKTDEHWHHYYSYDELYVLFANLIGVDDLNIRYHDGSYFVHFSKGTGKKAKPLKIIEDNPLE